MKEQISESTKKFIEGGYSEGVGFEEGANYMEQPEKTEPTKTSSYNISPSNKNPGVQDDVRQRVVEALQSSTEVDDTEITVNVIDQGHIQLSGYVESPEMAETAERIVRDLGVGEIDNQIKSGTY